ncbi:MAG: hypothetical protein COU11_02755 [Candidatus Harrisonbacteria bacterium CG10_big_fil_rev_8_21_14_0_10_49_15]|uniref:tetrahydrofolate synthase n=1 Tax=Candidatus Harrisonbacteria bacterium CG10_big_fil_rev_8_21_14_0_10_49_15 TaxID=1974587 RepID=A0A2H0UL42_9BACT|nr:MAG: hypothetical protein COU11_02755 [Candidatus Harrisonbacteria bacterium CG10_big_fil_rev_8_21_14_0_10_49_15]
MFTRYHDAVRYLEGLANLPNWYPHDGTAPELYERYIKRTQYFLGLLGNPERKLRFIQVAGTSGKGTVATMIANTLTLSGKKTGLFTSPFVTTTAEKTSIDGLFIAPDEFADLVDQLKPNIDKAYAKSPYGGPSYFEICFALSLLYFAQKKCDLVVLEVGLGGAYDATNAVPANTKLATALTNISLDHTEILGKTLTKIAHEKAGIIRPGVPFFTTETRPNLRKLFQARCQAEKTLCYFVEPSLDANRALAGAICRYLGVKESLIATGTSKLQLPARFEKMQELPVVILDGAHNPAKIAYTASQLADLDYNRLFLILGLAKNKNLPKTIAPIIPLADKIFATRFSNPLRPCREPHELAQAIQKIKNIPVSEFLDASQALDAALKQATKKDLILITGSFFLAGELRQRWYSEDWVLQNRRSR